MQKTLRIRKECGFTLIEMIGVLAVIGLLAALILPKVFEVIAESKAMPVAAAARAYEVAITNYFRDLGTLLPLNAAGVPAAEAGGDSTTAISLPARLTLDSTDALVLATNLWPRFQGPYLEKFNSAQVPGDIGTTMTMPSIVNAVALAAVVTATSLSFDLKGNAGNDIAVGDTLVYWRVAGMAQEDFDNLDNVLDSDMPGQTNALRIIEGRVKYDAATTAALIYITHR